MAKLIYWLPSHSIYLKWTSHSKRSTRRSKSSTSSTISSRRVLKSLERSSHLSRWLITSCSRLGRRGRLGRFSILIISCLRRLRICRRGRRRSRPDWNSFSRNWRCRLKTVLVKICRIFQWASSAQFRRGECGAKTKCVALVRGRLHEQLTHQELF